MIWTAIRPPDPPSEYHDYGAKWWNNEECPFSYSYLDLDSIYQEDYFRSPGHINEYWTARLFGYMQTTYRQLFGVNFESIIELGCGGGEITKMLEAQGIEYLSLEGSSNGVNYLIENRFPSRRIVKEDIRFSTKRYGYFDMCMCTELAEHVEPWFASKIPEVCSRHSDVVWFSAAKGDAEPHYNHPNEAPITAWDNIFYLFGFKYYMELDGTANRADRLYLKEQAKQRLV